jgi:hypothetical protein
VLDARLDPRVLGAADEIPRIFLDVRNARGKLRLVIRGDADQFDPRAPGAARVSTIVLSLS